ncbi:Hypothetical protein NTJ_10399 [Nesidiocoris tenuis]|uniref:dolichyl-phosphate-mannose--protein mannosyltransferase n=1 Tax=Nesidiocoris tenuis TaxID=355587 RepID=A0ABN7AZJ0_9HEMI|nr:Hypothetical protein NTJ_10399 [Nesidiocoris tenuis]
MRQRTYLNVLDKIISVIIGLVGVICFQGSLDGTFIFDDVQAVVNNKDVQLATPIWKTFKNDFWGTELVSNTSHKSYRPLTVLSFRFNVWLNGGDLHPRGFHILNIALHGINCAMMYPLLSWLFAKTKTWDVKPLIGSMLFAVHPIHTEAVAGIVGRADLMCAFFSIASMLIYAHATTLESGQSLHYTFLASFLAGFAMLSKEQGITTLGLCSAYDLIVANTIFPSDILMALGRVSKDFKIHRSGVILFKKAAGYHAFIRKQYRFMLWRQLILIFVGSTAMYLRCWVMNFETPTFQKVDNPASFLDNAFIRFLNYNYIYALNAWVLLCPEWLCFDWSMGCIPLIKMDRIQNNPRILSVLFFWLVMFSLVKNIFNLKYSFSLSQNIAMSLACLCIPFLPASNLFFRVGFVIAERVLYLPSIGYCMLVAIGMDYLFDKTEKKLLVYVGCTVLILANVSRCYQRSLDWRTERALFESGAVVCPLNAKVHYNLAKTSFNTTVAIRHYREALRLNPEYEQAMNNLANVLRDNGDIKESESLLRKAVMIRPDFAAAWMNLGIVLSNQKRYDEANSCYMTALNYRRFYPDCYYNLGNLYLAQQMYIEAFNAWRMATTQKPQHSIAWNNMIVMLDSLGDLEKAEALAKEALEHLPDDSSLHFNLANTLGKRSAYEDAEYHFKVAIRLKPNVALYHTNLGVLYHRWKKYRDAEEQYLIALSINSDLKNVEQNLKTVQKLVLKSKTSRNQQNVAE